MRTALLRGKALQAAVVALALTGPFVGSALARRPDHSKRKSQGGSQPTACLKQAGLSHVGKGTEQGVWEGHAKGSQLSDNNSTIYVDGPYGSRASAQSSAQSLKGVAYAVVGGYWVVQTTVRSRLDGTVRSVASCLAKSGKPSGKPFKRT